MRIYEVWDVEKLEPSEEGERHLDELMARIVDVELKHIAPIKVRLNAESAKSSFGGKNGQNDRAQMEKNLADWRDNRNHLWSNALILLEEDFASGRAGEDAQAVHKQYKTFTELNVVMMTEFNGIFEALYQYEQTIELFDKLNAAIHQKDNGEVKKLVQTYNERHLANLHSAYLCASSCHPDGGFPPLDNISVYLPEMNASSSFDILQTMMVARQMLANLEAHFSNAYKTFVIRQNFVAAVQRRWDAFRHKSKEKAEKNSRNRQPQSHA